MEDKGGKTVPVKQITEAKAKLEKVKEEQDQLRMRLGDLTFMRAQLEHQLKGCVTEQEQVLNRLSMTVRSVPGAIKNGQRTQPS